MTPEDADLFDTCEEQVKGMYEEIGLLSKKKPDGPVNKFKLKLINQLLAKVNNLLSNEYSPFDDFSAFDEDDLPTTSDVVFILSQYLKGMNKFRYDHTHYNSGIWYWMLDDGKDSWKKTKRSTFLKTE